MIFLKLDKMPLSEAYDDEIVQEANGKYQLSFKFPRKNDKWQYLTKETLLLADDLHGEQEFRIFEVVRRHGYVTVYANQVADDLNYKSITSISVDRVPGQTVMSALAGSIIQSHAFSFFSDISGRHSFNQSDVSVMKALSEGKHSIIGQWGGELVRDKYQVKLLERAGVDSEVLFMYKKNLSTFDQSESVKGLVTRLHLKKTIEENGNKSVIKTTVDSPLIGQYQLVYEANLEVQDQDVATVEQLRQYGIDYFRKNLPDIPDNSLSVDVANSADYTVKLFDTAIVHYDLYDIDMRMQITSYKYSPQSKKLKSVGFGKIKTSLTQQIRQDQQAQNDKLESVISEQELKFQAEIENANRHFDAEFDKRVGSINDGIEQAKAEAELYADNIKQSIDTEIAQVEQSMQSQAQEHDRQVADILSKTQSVESLANQAKSDAASAIARANQVKTEAIAEANRLIASARQTLDGQLAQQAQQLLIQASAQEQLTRRTSAVEQLANSTKTTLTELSKTVNSQTGQIDSVSKRTKTVEDGLTGLTARYENLSVGGTNLADLSNKNGWYNSGGNFVADNKYNATEFIAVENVDYTLQFWGKPNEQSNWVGIVFFDENKQYIPNSYWSFYPKTGYEKKVLNPQNAKYIAISYYNSNSKVQLEKGTIASDYKIPDVAMQRQIAEYHQSASENYAKLSETVQTAGNKIIETETLAKQTAKGLEARLTATQVNSLIDGKGFATTQTVQNLVTETAGSFERQITETRGLIPTEVGNRNLLKGTKDLSGNDAKRFNTLDKYLDFNIARSRPTTGYYDTFAADTTIPVTANDYILSFYAKSDVDGATLYCHFYSPNTTTSVESSTGYKGGSLDGLARVQVTTEWRRYWVKWSQRKTDIVKKVIVGRNNSADGIKTIEVAGVALYEGALNKGHFDAPEDLVTVTALHNVTDTVDSHTRTIGAVGETGSILDNVSKVTQTANGLVQEVSGANGLKTQVSQLAGSYAIKNLTKAGDVLGQINLNPDGSVRINEGLISVGTKTYIQDGVITSAKIAGLDAGKITTGTLDAARIAVNSIDGSKMVFDQAFVDKMTANEAYLKQLFAKDAFITQVQSVTLSANQILGGIINAINSAMQINLNQANITFNQNATIDFNSANNALVRKKGTHTAFLHFEDVPGGQDNNAGSIYAGLGVTSSGDGIDSKSKGRFAGLRIYRAAAGTSHTAIIDQIQMYGDTIKLRDDFSIERGFDFRTTSANKVYDMNYVARKSEEAVSAIRILRRCMQHFIDVSALGNDNLLTALRNRMNDPMLKNF